MSLSGVARETLAIIERGSYRAPSGREVDLRARVDGAVSGTELYTPDDLEALLASPCPLGSPSEGGLRLEVTGETTGEASRRLVEAEGVPRVVALNFASARHPGGGFLGGARAQEEDLARCSALYPCQLTQRAYYDANRASASLLYTDHVIYSPEVPFFRDEDLELLEEPFTVSVITAPAPNAGEAKRREPRLGKRLREALERRAGMVLSVAEARGHRALVLGAWGCGVFRNEPAEVADAFAGWLSHPRFSRAFERVVFGVYDRSAGAATRRAFEARFAGW